jgi:hypothetical protein
VRNRQPVGGLIGLGTSPTKWNSVALFSKWIRNLELLKAMPLNKDGVGDQIFLVTAADLGVRLPKYITATRSQKFLMTAKSVRNKK